MALKKTVPVWSAAGVEPPESLKTNGFQPGQKPPAAYFNWYMNGMSKAVEELQENHSIGVPAVAATSTDGGHIYAATVPGVDSLFNGLTITIIPDTTSASAHQGTFLTVNNLGAKHMVLPVGDNNTTYAMPTEPGFFSAGSPVTVQYDASVSKWKVVGRHKVDASNVNGLAAVATSGNYDDLKGKPSIPEAITVDSALSSSSTNPVENNVVNSALSGKAPTYHSSSSASYGLGTSNNYGHVKLSDSTSSTSGVNGGMAATPAAVKAAYDLANDKAASSHTHAASDVSAGTLAGRVQGNATAMATLSNAQVRNISAGTSDLTAGTSTLATGTLYFVYE